MPVCPAPARNTLPFGGLRMDGSDGSVAQGSSGKYPSTSWPIIELSEPTVNCGTPSGATVPWRVEGGCFSPRINECLFAFSCCRAASSDVSDPGTLRPRVAVRYLPLSRRSWSVSKRANSKIYLSKESRSLFAGYAVAAFTERLRICCFTSTTSPEKRDANNRTASGSKSETSSRNSPNIKHADALAEAPLPDAVGTGAPPLRPSSSSTEGLVENAPLFLGFRSIFATCRTTSRRTMTGSSADTPAPCCSNCRIATNALDTTEASTDRHSSRSWLRAKSSNPRRTSSAHSGRASATRAAAVAASHTKSFSVPRQYVCSSRRISSTLSGVANRTRISSLISRLNLASVPFTKKSRKKGANMAGRSEAMTAIDFKTTYWISGRLRRMRTRARPIVSRSSFVGAPQ
mmetsp:Transcript_183/g.671  ORF Transcript_183/g.671 Transcript_183/m.671 type:complete len:403 (-) Transcript_183:1285-2493(-)